MKQQFQLQDDDFIVLQKMTPQQETQLMRQRFQQLTTFYQTNKNYQISHWYPPLQKFTFKSFKTYLTSIDAYILYWLYYNDQDLQKMQKQQPKLYQYYLALIKRVDLFFQNQCFQLKREKQFQCFMKLATRSPKDYGYKYSANQIQNISDLLVDHLRTKLHNYQQQMKQNLSSQFINEIYYFFLNLSKEKFKVKNAKDFVEIFSHSERIIIDISDFSFLKADVFTQFAQKNYTRADQVFIQLWAREWQDFKWYEQFRCFFKDFKLTATTQYDQRCYFSQLINKEQLIEKQMFKFFDQIKPSLKELQLSEGVMDLVFFGVNNKNKQIKTSVKLIEINVFNRNSRASLFNWDRDYNILCGQEQNKFELRLLKQPISISRHEVCRLMGMVQKGPQQIIQRAMQKLNLKELWQRYE